MTIYILAEAAKTTPLRGVVDHDLTDSITGLQIWPDHEQLWQITQIKWIINMKSI